MLSGIPNRALLNPQPSYKNLITFQYGYKLAFLGNLFQIHHQIIFLPFLCLDNSRCLGRATPTHVGCAVTGVSLCCWCGRNTRCWAWSVISPETQAVWRAWWKGNLQHKEVIYLLSHKSIDSLWPSDFIQIQIWVIIGWDNSLSPVRLYHVCAITKADLLSF